MGAVHDVHVDDEAVLLIQYPALHSHRHAASVSRVLPGFSDTYAHAGADATGRPLYEHAEQPPAAPVVGMQNAGYVRDASVQAEYNVHCTQLPLEA